MRATLNPEFTKKEPITRISCPCGYILRIKPSQKGRVVPCPFCGRTHGTADPRFDLNWKPNAKHEIPRDLKMEAHIRSIGIWCLLSPVLFLLFGWVVYPSSYSLQASVLFIILGVLMNHYLRSYDSWMRGMVGILACLGAVGQSLGLAVSLLNTPVSTLSLATSLSCIIFLVSIVVTLANPRAGRVCTRSYRRMIRDLPERACCENSHHFWIPWILVGLCATSTLGTFLLLKIN